MSSTVLVVLLGLLLSAQAQFNHSLSKRSGYTNPLVQMSAPDPTVLLDGGKLYVYTTGSSDKCNICLYVSADGDTFTPNLAQEGYQEALSPSPSWAVAYSTSRPSVVKALGQYYMYYSAQHNNGNKCIGLATSTSPAGPFKDAGDGHQIACAAGNYFDAQVFIDTNNVGWMFYGQQAAPKSLYYQQMSSNLRSFASGSAMLHTVAGSTSRPYESDIGASWVQHVPSQGYYYLYYSGDQCCGSSPHYAVGVARSKSVKGPWTKNTQSPIFVGNKDFSAPGSITTFVDNDGTTWALYQAYDSAFATNKRSFATVRMLMMDKVTYANGWPKIGNGSPSSSQSAGPAI